MGLRDEKKQATRTAIADTALSLFLSNGFDRVTVSDVAGAARVSVNTVFNYFPTKEDLFFDRQADVVQRLARAAAGRAPGESVVEAVHRAFLDAVRRNDPTLGIDSDIVAFWRVVDGSPALQARARLLAELTEAALAEKLAEMSGTTTDPLVPHATAAVIAGVDRALHAEIRRRISLGEHRDTVRTAIISAAERAFAAVRGGIDTYFEAVAGSESGPEPHPKTADG
ncbi:TetR family transcriptional regulator [Actinoplanes italicus]|uniref:TetR family transcriptional regulator n=1 Tax=Actinoplanes italicus TaxID=113567 RepID=A0A2T0K9Y8_9ACTN|nr:TetR family transcriptional regulator [Actinoplanes italicus]PRX19962.1 TetR family transcriptional regulator [Actinoplanes italicus]GIE31815.1 TetR family transcriptional regulator [Actinoplanes italicus]